MPAHRRQLLTFMHSHLLARPARVQLPVEGGRFKCAEKQAGADFVVLGEAVAPGFDFQDFTWTTADMLASRLAKKADAGASEDEKTRLRGFIRGAKDQAPTDAYYAATAGRV